MDAHLRSLLDRPAWIKGLARSLASDTNQAEDLVQDTWVAALSRPPRRGVPLGRWVAKVMRNSQIRGLRSEGRRRERERSVARGEVDLSSEELLVRFDLQRSLADAVAELREPYRTAILLRYFEQISPKEIAARINVPVRTVHSRVHRGLEMLRERLQPRREDERRAWMIALGAFGRGTEPLETSIAGALLMSTKLKVAVGLVAVGLFFLARTALTPERAPSDAGQTGKSLAAATLLETKAPIVLPGPSQEEGRHEIEPEGTPEIGVEPPDQAEVALPPLRGLVIDPSGSAVGGVPVVYVPFGREPGDFEPHISDGQGRFEIPEPFSSGQIDAVGESWATVLQPRRLDHVTEEPVLVVAPAITLSGVVLDEKGAPVPAARLSLGMPGGMRSKLDAIVDESHTREWETKTDDQGWFEFPRVPSVAGTKLHASARGYVATKQAFPLEGHTSLEIELVRSDEQYALLEGRILDVEGRPVEGAWVTLGKASARVDSEGFFRLVAKDRDEEPVLRAAAKGFLATEIEGRPGRELQYAFADPLVVVLSTRSTQLAGRVLDGHGQPAVGVQVWTPDETPFGDIPFDPDADDAWTTTQTIEAMARGEHPFFSEPVTTDEEGKFELTGLFPRPYVVCAWDERTHAFAQSEPTLPGEFVEMRIPLTDMRPRVAGVVLGLRGDPVVGAKVQLGSAVRIEPSRGEKGFQEETRYSQQTLTDEDGRFELTDVSHSARWLYVAGGGVADSRKELLPEDVDFEALEIRIPLRCRLQVILTPGWSANRMQVLDEEGTPIALVVKHGWVATGSHWHTFQDERSEVLRVSERARMLVLYKGDLELTRLALQLEIGELNIVRP